jgi:hypothetical protein
LATKHWLGTTTSFTLASNWSDGAAPVNSDTIIFNHYAVGSCTANISTVLTGITVIVEKSYTYNIGTLTTAGVGTYLVLDGGTLINGQQTGGPSSSTGSPLIMVNFGSTAGVVYMYDSASTSSSLYVSPVIVKGTGITLFQTGGNLGIAPLTGETATLTAGTISRGTGSVAPSLFLGSGVTQTALTAKAGTVFSRSGQTAAATTINGTAIYTTEGTGAHTTVTCDGEGVVNYGCTGTITTLNLSGQFSNEQYSQAFTITDRNFYKGARYFTDNGKATSITTTNAYSLKNIGLQDMQVRTPPGKNI